jgi:CheY-like chemotaxis protein
MMQNKPQNFHLHNYALDNGFKYRRLMLIMVCKVLLVDDEPHLLAGYKRILEDYCDPLLATGAVDALLLLASRGPFDVLVTDYYMPYMNGVELLIEAYQLSPETEMVNSYFTVIGLA